MPIAPPITAVTPVHYPPLGHQLLALPIKSAILIRVVLLLIPLASLWAARPCKILLTDQKHNTKVITTTSAAALTFTPSSTYTGIVSSVVIKQLTTQVNPVLTLNNSSSTTTLEIRSSGTTSNIFIRLGSGKNNTSSGTYNTAIGSYSLMNNTTGPFNTALGSFALEHNTNGGSIISPLATLPFITMPPVFKNAALACLPFITGIPLASRKFRPWQLCPSIAIPPGGDNVAVGGGSAYQ